MPAGRFNVRLKCSISGFFLLSESASHIRRDARVFSLRFWEEIRRDYGHICLSANGLFGMCARGLRRDLTKRKRRKKSLGFKQPEKNRRGRRKKMHRTEHVMGGVDFRMSQGLAGIGISDSLRQRSIKRGARWLGSLFQCIEKRRK